jgi:hypothetical protein
VSETTARGRTALQRLCQNSADSTWSVETLAEVAAYGEVVWSWHPLLMPSLAEAKPAQPGEVAVNPLGDGDKKEFVAEESTKETVKTIARGKPGDLRCTRGDYRVHYYQCTRAAGAPGARLSLLPLQVRDNVFAKPRASHAARILMRASSSAVMLRACGASSIPEAPVLETRSRGVLDTPLSGV